jgi:hypothetical protein
MDTVAMAAPLIVAMSGENGQLPCRQHLCQAERTCAKSIEASVCAWQDWKKFIDAVN